MPRSIELAPHKRYASSGFPSDSHHHRLGWSPALMIILVLALILVLVGGCGTEAGSGDPSEESSKQSMPTVPVDVSGTLHDGPVYTGMKARERWVPPGWTDFRLMNYDPAPCQLFIIKAESFDDLPVDMVLDPFEGTFVPELRESALGSQLIGKHELPSIFQEDLQEGEWQIKVQYELAAGTYLLIVPDYFAPEQCLKLIVAEPSTN